MNLKETSVSGLVNSRKVKDLEVRMVKEKESETREYSAIYGGKSKKKRDGFEKEHNRLRGPTSSIL